MALYRFRVWMDEVEDFERVIEIPANKTFEDLHKAILQSIDFDESQLASFYLTDENWNEKMEITLIDMSSGAEDEFIPIMNETRLSDYVKEPGQKLQYVYDFVLMWNFRVELAAIQAKFDSSLSYPAVVNSLGESPSQYGTEEKYPEALSEEEDSYVTGLRKRNEEDILDSDDFDEDEDDDDPFGEFENGYDSGYDRDDRY